MNDRLRTVSCDVLRILFRKAIMMPPRRRLLIWMGRAVFAGIIAGLVIYLVSVGLDKADKIASSVGVVIALLALGAPYLLRTQEPPKVPEPPVDRVEHSGDATATGGGRANSGIERADVGGPAQVTRSGNARADAKGSSANTGVGSESPE
jgi:hypothetical protein